MKDWMSENSREHYCGVPNKDECMELTGRVSLGVVLIVIIVAIIFW